MTMTNKRTALLVCVLLLCSTHSEVRVLPGDGLLSSPPGEQGPAAATPARCEIPQNWGEYVGDVTSGFVQMLPDRTLLYFECTSGTPGRAPMALVPLEFGRAVGTSTQGVVFESKGGDVRILAVTATGPRPSWKVWCTIPAKYGRYVGPTGHHGYLFRDDGTSNFVECSSSGPIHRFSLIGK
jgi:hypothetical protein